MRGITKLVVFGATIGSLLDALHTYSGTTEYTPSLFLRAAWWTPVIFAGAYGLGGYAYALAYPRGRPIAPPRALGAGLVVFALLYAASGFLPAGNVAKLVVLFAGALALWAWLDRTLAGALLACVAAFGGPLTEIVLVHFGTFRHLQPDFLGIPMWLPALYLSSGPSFGQIARHVVRSRS